jgi:predicted nucleotidyltransferase
MSGNYVQRGENAIQPKHIRAMTAVMGGVDIVLELPAVFSTASAGYFAEAGVSLLSALGCADRLCFGSESGDIESLTQAAEVLAGEKFNAEIREYISENPGTAYPKALHDVYGRICGGASVLLGSNNILAVEYIKAVKKLAPGIKPETIKRIGREFNDPIISRGESLLSATAIRAAAYGGNLSAVQAAVPTNVYDALACGNLSRLDKLEPAVISHILRKTPEELSRYSDVTNGFEYKIASEVRKCTSLTDLYGRLASKQYTASRVRRIVLSAFLEITKEHLKSPPRFTALLGANKKGCELLNRIRKTAAIPILTKPSDGHRLPKEDRVLTEQYNINVFADKVYSMTLEHGAGANKPYIQRYT